MSFPPLLGQKTGLAKTLRWLRWSTICAILFYMFFIGLILHSTTYKLQHTLKSSRRQSQQQPHDSPPDNVDSARPHVSNEVGGHHVLPSTFGSLYAQSQVAAEQGIALGAAGSRTKSNEPETVILAASSVNEKQILAKAFRRADRNHDGRLSIQELAVYINRKINDHIEEAIQLNPREFRRVDIAPPDGLISWEEYHRYFLKQHGLSDADVDEHDEIRHTSLNRRAREEMMRDKARWSEAARTDAFSLTIDEFLAFRHPESSVSNLLELVDDLLRQFDQDGDDQLSVDEFSDVTVNDDEDLIRKSLISRTVVERKEEFKRILDRNHDGKADREELLNYVNPKTPRYALQESATLFHLADENQDGMLTLDELTGNAEIFLSSKMVDTANSFHTEF